MTRAERRRRLKVKFKKRLKYCFVNGFCVKVNGKWRKATAWDQLKEHYEFRDQAVQYKRDKEKIWNQRGLKKQAFQRVQEQLEEIESDYNIIVKSRFSDVKDKTYGL